MSTELMASSRFGGQSGKLHVETDRSWGMDGTAGWPDNGASERCMQMAGLGVGAQVLLPSVGLIHIWPSSPNLCRTHLHSPPR